MKSSPLVILFFVICSVQSIKAEGDVNGKIITDLKMFPKNNMGTIGDRQSLEVNIDAYQDFGSVRGVLELVGRTDSEDSGRRILEARQAYLKTDISDFVFFVGI